MTDDVKVKYPVARMHKFLHSAPQFRPIKRGSRRRGIERKYTSADGNQTLTMMLFYELDIADQDLLLCLIAMAMATDKSTIVSAEPTQEINMILREKLKLDGELVTKMPAISCATTGYEILTELNRSTGASGYRWLEDSLKRLSGVSFVYKTLKSINTFHLMSWSAKLTDKGRLDGISFCINPYSAVAIFGEKGGYALLHRGERAQLSRDEAKGLHSILCGWVDLGGESTFSVDVLADKLYSRYDEVIGQDAREWRRKGVTKGCEELNKLGYWSCSVVGRGSKATVVVSRKKPIESDRRIK